MTFTLHRVRRAATLALVPAAVIAGGVTGLPAATAQAAARAGGRTLAPVVRSNVHIVSGDPFTNPGAQHATEVEPDIASHGDTLVATFQQGRFADGGSADTGWATSHDGGRRWRHGSLPGLTVFDGGTFARASDPVATYDKRHHEWIITSLLLKDNPPASDNAGLVGNSIAVSRSRDGVHWQRPVVTATNPGSIDKDWVTCDNHPASPHFGTCYLEWDSINDGQRILMARSTDGGATWTRAHVRGGASGIGGQPVVQPGGRVIMPISGVDGNVDSIVSADGGRSWGEAGIAGASPFGSIPADLRTGSMPSAAVDAGGTVYVVWARSIAPHRTELVMSSSDNGVQWSQPQSIPTSVNGQRVDPLTPGIGIEPGTRGEDAHLAVAYYEVPAHACRRCKVKVAMVTSPDGGWNWGAPTTLAAGMAVRSFPATDQGRMFGDYIATAFTGDVAHPVFAVARPKQGTAFDVGIAVANRRVPAGKDLR